MSKIAFIYPGQGAQAAGMGADFYERSRLAREVFDEASALLELDMKAWCFEANDKLDVTEYTQAAMVTTCLAMTKVIEAEGLKPDITAGLSLGEYCAIAVAGGMSPIDAVKTVRARGILMQNTVPAGEGAMAAILGMTGEEIEKVIDETEDVTVANYNCPGQIVITGKTEAVKTACEALSAAGAKRTVPLNVSGPFHSPMLKSAGEELTKVLDTVEFTSLQIPYVTNVNAQKVTDIAETKELLRQQVSSSVMWEQSIRTMIEDGVDIFVEIGPGKTLSGFMRKISRDVKMFKINNIEEMHTVIEAIKEITEC